MEDAKHTHTHIHTRANNRYGRVCRAQIGPRGVTAFRCYFFFYFFTDEKQVSVEFYTEI